MEEERRKGRDLELAETVGELLEAKGVGVVGVEDVEEHGDAIRKVLRGVEVSKRRLLRRQRKSRRRESREEREKKTKSKGVVLQDQEGVDGKHD